MILKSLFILAISGLFLALVSPSFGLAMPELDPTGALFGPTVVVEAAGITPIAQGTWIPSATAHVAFTWLEPLQDVRLGSPLGPKPQFMRFAADAHLTPWYGMLQTMVGFRLIPHTEVAFVYQVNAYFYSNVEMSSSNLRETWRSDYFFDHTWSQSTMDYSQAFGIWGALDFPVGKAKFGGEFRHFLIDVRTKSPEKSFDFVRGLPVYDRDFFFEALGWGRLPVSPTIQIGLEVEYQQTGLFTKTFGHYEKQPVRQGLVFLGPRWRSPDGRHSLVLEPGFFVRQHDYLKGSLMEQVLIRAIWQTQLAWERKPIR